MEKGKILVTLTPCDFWFACKANQGKPVFGYYGLTKDEAVAQLRKYFPESKDWAVEER